MELDAMHIVPSKYTAARIDPKVEVKDADLPRFELLRPALIALDQKVGATRAGWMMRSIYWAHIYVLQRSLCNYLAGCPGFHRSWDARRLSILLANVWGKHPAVKTDGSPYSATLVELRVTFASDEVCAEHAEDLGPTRIMVAERSYEGVFILTDNVEALRSTLLWRYTVDVDMQHFGS